MSVCDVPVIAEVCAVAGEGAASLISAPFDWLAQSMGSAAAWMFEAVWSAFDSTTLVDLTDPAYIDVYNVLFGVAVFVTLMFFCLQLITGLIRRDPTALSRAAIGLAKSILGSFVIITITGLLLEVTDQLAVGVVQASGNTMEGMGERIALLAVGLSSISIGAPGVGAIVTIFLSALAISGAAIVWFSLLIRKALLLVAIVFGPIALAGATWDAAKGWFTKWVAFVVALILSKLVLVVIFLVAVTQVSAPIDADLASVSDPIAGIVLMFIAAFAPYVTYKFLNFVGLDIHHAMSSEQEAKSALNRPIPVPHSPMIDGAKKILGPSSGGATTATAAPGAGGAAAGSKGAGSGAASSGAAGTTSAGAAAGGATAGATIAAAAIGTAATAGPNIGGAVGQTADIHTQSAIEGSVLARPEPQPPQAGPTAPSYTPTPAPGTGRKDV